MNSGQIILINKPYRWTSFDVVRRIKGALIRKMDLQRELPSGEKTKLKVGHAGTLDPLATGLLILCTGSLTKKISEIQDAEKEYTGSFIVGATTESHDLETAVKEMDIVPAITDEQIREAANKFLGLQMQTPPAHSAVKVDGKRAYSLARKGKEVVLKPKEIEIKEFHILLIDLPRIDFRVVCSKGTYIRTLAHDFGKALGSGAYLSALSRVRIGRFLLEDALDPETFISQLPDKQEF